MISARKTVPSPAIQCLSARFPSPILLFSIFHFRNLTAKSCRIRTSEKCTRNPFRMNTSKTLDLKPFGMNTYEKTRGEGVLWLTILLEVLCATVTKTPGVFPFHSVIHSWNDRMKQPVANSLPVDDSPIAGEASSSRAAPSGIRPAHPHWNGCRALAPSCLESRSRVWRCTRIRFRDSAASGNKVEFGADGWRH